MEGCMYSKINLGDISSRKISCVHIWVKASLAKYVEKVSKNIQFFYLYS